MAALLHPPLAFVTHPLASTVSRSLPLRGLLPPVPSPHSSANRFQNGQRTFQLGSLIGVPPTQPYSIPSKRKMMAHASSATDGTDSSNADAPKEGAEGSSVESLPLETKLQLKLEQKLRMKLAKKIRLRRKRLVRKRMMRKKGRWPPSKMKKNKNV